VKKHPFDPLSFIFGALFLLAGLPLLVSESGFKFFEGRWVFPAFLVLAGVVVLATAQLSSKDASEDDHDPFSYEDPS
jgi:hypothetical protein